jgi:Flp pilus assembly protein TadD
MGQLTENHSGWWKLSWILGAGVGLALIGGAGILVHEHRAVERDARSARGAFAAGRPAMAVEPLRRWFRARPSSPEVHALLAEAALAGGDLAEVGRELERARSLGCPESKLEKVHAIVLARLGRYAEAEPILTRLWTEQEITDPAVDEALARIFLKTYRLFHARKVIERWIKDAPADGRPFVWLTEIDRRTNGGDPALPEVHYRAALERDPDLDTARLGLADSLRTNHRNDEASLEYERCLARSPEDPAALSGAGQNALEMNDLSRAAHLLDRALVQTPNDPSALKARARVALHTGDLPTARRMLDQVIGADAFDEEAFYIRARVRAMEGDFAGAKADGKIFDHLKHEQEEMLSMRARLLNDPADNDSRAKAVAWLFEHGRDKDGLEWAAAILANNPNHGPTCRLLADYYEKRSDGAGLANFYRLKASTKASDAE